MTRRVRIGLVVFSGILLTAAIAYLCVQTALSLRSDLLSMRQDLDAGVQAATSGDIDTAQQRFASARTTGARAVGRAQGPPMQLVGFIPGAGSTVRSVRAVTESAMLVAQAGDRLLTSLQEVPGGIDELTVATTAEGGAGWLNALAAVEDPLGDVEVMLTLAADLLEDAPPQTRVVEVDRARAQLATQVDEVLPAVRRSRGLVAALPELLGADGPRTYFLGAQNPAELRGTGGLIGAYAVLTADEGQVEITPFRQVQSLERNIFSQETSPSQDFFDRYGTWLVEQGTWLNINFSPDFPSVAQTIEALYEESTGQRLDGVLVVDPFALEAMLQVTGPVVADDPDVGRLTASSVVPFVTNQAYGVLGTGEQNAQRKEVLGEAARTVLAHFLGGGVSGEARVRALARAARGGHLLVHAVDPEIQDGLLAAGVAGALPDPDGLSLAVIGTNLAEGKADYYVERQVDWTINLDPDGSATAEVVVSLTNNAPGEGLRYVLGPGERSYPGVPLGTNFTLLSLYCGDCQVLSSQYADDRDFGEWQDTERGHSVVSTIERLDRNETQVVRHVLEIPQAWVRAGDRGTMDARFFTQPTINGTSLTVRVQPPAGWEILPRDPMFTPEQDSMVLTANPDYEESYVVDLTIETE